MNQRANIMGLQYGRDICEKMQIGKRHRNPDLCKEGKEDGWKDIIIKDMGGDENLENQTFL